MLQIKDIYKRYKTGDFVQTALNGVSLTLRDNEFVAILGPSGSGKTTLLNIIGGLDRYDSGDLIINGISTKKYKDRDWDAYRNHTIGFVFQSYNLIPHQTVLSNVELALTLSGVSASEKKKRAEKALIKVGLGDHMHKKPNQMSGGQMQRVAIARALVNEPDIILADEPTGALDSETSVQIMELLKEVAKDKLVVMVTHNPELADQYANRIVRVKDGNIIADSNPVPVAALAATHQTMKWTHLGFATALGLSMNNLMTKKGRTLLTAFAGAIGIIGIASILSLSNGVNDYIKDLENDMLGSYPLEIDRSAYDLTSMMSMRQERIEEMSEDKSDRDDSLIYSNNVVADALSATQSLIKENNLARFKLYLDSHMDELENAVSAVEYSYDVSPYVFRKDGDDIVKVSPGSLIDTSGSRMLSYSLNASWTQLVSSQSLLEKQYELLAGDWPDAPDEIAVVLTSDNELSDYTLYAIGAMELNKLNDLVDAISDEEEYEDPEETFTYDDILGKEFKVFSPSQMYVFSEVSSDGSGTEDENSDSENSASGNSASGNSDSEKSDSENSASGNSDSEKSDSENSASGNSDSEKSDSENSNSGKSDSEKSDSKSAGSANSASKTFSFLNKSEEDAEVYSAWLDKSDDDDYIASIYESGFSCKITCILRATEDAAISSGLAYDKSLTYKLLEVAKDSDVVKEQMANPEINVLTGKPFVEEDEEDTEATDGDEDSDDADTENSESDASASANGAAGSNASGSIASGSIASATASDTSGASTLTHIPSHKVLASAVSDSTSNSSIRDAAAGSYLLAVNDANTSTTEASDPEAGGLEEATSETTDSSLEESTEGNGSAEESSNAGDTATASEETSTTEAAHAESSDAKETSDTAESSKAQETSQASESSAAEEGDKGSESSASGEGNEGSESSAAEESSKPSESTASRETTKASETPAENETSAAGGIGSSETSGANESSSANGSSGSNESSSANESSEADSSNGNTSEGGSETPSGPNLSFDSLTAEQLAALLETITGSEPGTILPEQVSAAMSAIAAADLQNMTVTDLVELISQASGQDFNVSIPVTPDQMEDLTASILDSLSPDQMTALTKYLMDNVSEEQMTALMAGVMGNLTDSQMNGLMAAVLGSLSEEQMAGLMQNMYGNLTDEQIKALMGNSDFSSLFSNLTEAQMQAMMAQVIGNLTDDQIAALIGQSMGSLTQEQLAALMGGMDLSSMLGSLSKEQLAALMGGMDISSIFSNMTQEELMALLGDQLADNLDWEQLLKDAGYDLESLYGTGSMSDDMLAVLMARMSGSTPSSYEEVLEALGYCDLEDPSTIYIYPTDFDGKGVVEDMIERYNNEAVDEKDQVTYTDLIATISSSITSIIDTISYVLIAFVSISLIVSSIMIAIITYISVLERTKEIGVLRALGASKNDVSRIFNAETFIEGLISGIIGIVVTVLLCIPVNRIVYDWQGIERIAVLPPVAGVILIAISVILTLIAGFAPSRMASKKDPVLALRSE